MNDIFASSHELLNSVQKIMEKEMIDSLLNSDEDIQHNIFSATKIAEDVWDDFKNIRYISQTKNIIENNKIQIEYEFPNIINHKYKDHPCVKLELNDLFKAHYYWNDLIDVIKTTGAYNV